MSLNFSGFTTQAVVDSLATKYAALATEYAALTSSASVSDQGRSVDFGKQAESILKQMEQLRLEAARLAGPTFVTSKMRS